MDNIIPFLWFADNNAKEAMEYYCSVFPNSRIVDIQYYPDDSQDPHLKGMAGKVLTGEFVLAGHSFMAIDGGPYFRFTEAISLFVPCRDQAEIDHYWQALSHHPENEQCGWCKDRFGLSWQIVPRDMGNLINSPQAMQAMMGMKKIDIQALVDAALG